MAEDRTSDSFERLLAKLEILLQRLNSLHGATNSSKETMPQSCQLQGDIVTQEEIDDSKSLDMVAAELYTNEMMATPLQEEIGASESLDLEDSESDTKEIHQSYTKILDRLQEESDASETLDVDVSDSVMEEIEASESESWSESGPTSKTLLTRSDDVESLQVHLQITIPVVNCQVFDEMPFRNRVQSVHLNAASPMILQEDMDASAMMNANLPVPNLLHDVLEAWNDDRTASNKFFRCTEHKTSRIGVLKEVTLNPPKSENVQSEELLEDTIVDATATDRGLSRKFVMPFDLDIASLLISQARIRQHLYSYAFFDECKVVLVSVYGNLRVDITGIQQDSRFIPPDKLVISCDSENLGKYDCTLTICLKECMNEMFSHSTSYVHSIAYADEQQEVFLLKISHSRPLEDLIKDTQPAVVGEEENVAGVLPFKFSSKRDMPDIDSCKVCQVAVDKPGGKFVRLGLLGLLVQATIDGVAIYSTNEWVFHAILYDPHGREAVELNATLHDCFVCSVNMLYLVMAPYSIKAFVNWDLMESFRLSKLPRYQLNQRIFVPSKWPRGRSKDVFDLIGQDEQSLEAKLPNICTAARSILILWLDGVQLLFAILCACLTSHYMICKIVERPYILNADAICTLNLFKHDPSDFIPAVLRIKALHAMLELVGVGSGYHEVHVTMQDGKELYQLQHNIGATLIPTLNKIFTEVVEVHCVLSWMLHSEGIIGDIKNAISLVRPFQVVEIGAGGFNNLTPNYITPIKEHILWLLSDGEILQAASSHQMLIAYMLQNSLQPSTINNSQDKKWRLILVHLLKGVVSAVFILMLSPFKVALERQFRSHLLSQLRNSCFRSFCDPTPKGTSGTSCKKLYNLHNLEDKVIFKG